MVGYSGTLLVKKLWIKEDHRLAFPGAPEGFAELLGELPDGAEVRDPLVDKQVWAIDETRFGLRLVIRRRDR